MQQAKHVRKYGEWWPKLHRKYVIQATETPSITQHNKVSKESNVIIIENTNHASPVSLIALTKPRSSISTETREASKYQELNIKSSYGGDVTIEEDAILTGDDLLLDNNVDNNSVPKLKP